MAKSSTLSYMTGKAVRLACRTEHLSSATSGLAPSYIQANLVVLPSRYADDFRLLCQRNPIPCPLIAESRRAGDFHNLKSRLYGITDSQLAADLDLRSDGPRYMIYKNGAVLKSDLLNVAEYWTDDHIAFLIGCSFSFETALSDQGLVPAHVKHGRNVPMYRTSIPLHPSGIFENGTYVVSMRLYRAEHLDQIRSITRPFVATHGEPIAWGWDGAKRIGITNIYQPEWGDAPVCDDGQLLEQVSSPEETSLIPVFWGCGVTPQDAIMQAGLEGIVIGHAPGHMLLLDIRDQDIILKQS